MRLREFSADGDGIATLVCAPLALHDATLTDFAPGHSLVAGGRRRPGTGNSSSRMMKGERCRGGLGFVLALD
jgi:hypothetical protein